MIARKTTMLVAMGACLLGLLTLGSQKNPVERPHKGWGHFTAVVDLTTGDFEANGVGHSTHWGRSRNTMAGQMDLDTFAVLWGFGIMTVANGDEVFLEANEDGSTAITGGSGRFEGATGSVVATAMWNVETSVDLDTMTMTMSYDALLEGTITY